MWSWDDAGCGDAAWHSVGLGRGAAEWPEWGREMADASRWRWLRRGRLACRRCGGGLVYGGRKAGTAVTVVVVMVRRVEEGGSGKGANDWGLLWFDSDVESRGVHV